MEYYIHKVPVFLMSLNPPQVNIPEFCQAVEETVTAPMCRNLDVVYIADIPELAGRSATYAHGAIYMSSSEPTVFDMVENFVHEMAHSLESTFGQDIFTEELISEFRGKRERLYQILKAEGFKPSERLFGFTEYTEKMDLYLAEVVGYPTLLSLTMGLFVSPYGATSLQEYYANGFEKYFLDNPRKVRDTSPVLYNKIVEILDELT